MDDIAHWDLDKIAWKSWQLFGRMECNVEAMRECIAILIRVIIQTEQNDFNTIILTNAKHAMWIDLTVIKIRIVARFCIPMSYIWIISDC